MYVSERYDYYFDEGDKNPGASLSPLIFAENSDVLVSVPGIHGSLDTATKTNLVLILGGLPSTHPNPAWGSQFSVQILSLTLF